MTELSIVIPTLNEADNIDALFQALVDTLDQPPLTKFRTEVIVVDDQSSDDTVQRARTWVDRLQVRVLERSGKPDLSGAVLDGVRAAEGQWVIVMDADGSHPPSAIPQMLVPLLEQSHDVVIGSRHVPGARTSHWPWHRHLTSRLATLLAWPFTEVKDPMAGFFATTRDRLLNLSSAVSGYKILLELLVQGGDDVRVKEIPIHFEDRNAGTSKLTAQQQLTYLRRLMNLGGGRVSAQTAYRFLGVGSLGMAVDLLLFWLLLATSSNLALAHISSFAAATICNFFFNDRWTFKGSSQMGDGPIRRYLRFVAVAILAMLMRGGVLVLLVDSLHWSPMLAIFPAIAATAAINYLGSAFYVFASTESGVIKRVRWHLAALGLFVFVFLLRWLYVPHLPLMPDEMYYWVYAQHLDWAYLDHPPLTAWLIKASTGLFGDHVVGVRASLVPIVLVGAWYFYRYGATMGGRTVGLLTMLALIALPFFFLSGLVMTPDAPMIVAWAAGLYYLKRLLLDGEEQAFWGLGIAMGIGLLAKYTIALLGLGGLVFILLDAKARQWLLKPHLYLSILIALLIFSPVIVWNAENQWASFGFQFTRRLIENPDFSSHLVIVYAVLLLSPVFALAGFYMFLPVAAKISSDQRKRRFMLVMTAVPLMVFLIYGAFSVTKFHWTLPAWIAMIPMVMLFLMGDYLPRGVSLGRFHRLMMRIWAPSVLVLTIFYGLLLHYLTLGLPGIKQSDWGTAYLSWPELTQQVEQLAQDIETATGMYPIVATTDKWGMAAALSFHGSDALRARVTAQNLIGMSGSMWGFWFDASQPNEQPILLVHHKAELIDEDWIGNALLGVGPLQIRAVKTTDRSPTMLYYRTASGFRPEQLRTPRQSPLIP